MTDHAAELRAIAGRTVFVPTTAGQHIREAADELDRLRAELARRGELLTDLATAYEHRQAVLRRGHSDYIRENGRKGGSPWGELMAALEAVLDARHEGIVRQAAADTRAVAEAERAGERIDGATMGFRMRGDVR